MADTADTVETVEIDLDTITDFDTNETYIDGTPIAAVNLNKPLKLLKRQVNHIHWLIHQLMNGTGIPAFIAGTAYPRNKIVNNNGDYYVCMIAGSTTLDGFRKISVPGALGNTALIQQAMTNINQAFQGTHAPGEVFAYPFLNAIEQTMVSYSSMIEYYAEIHRLQGASGMFSTRQYTYDQPFDPKERIFGVTYNAMGQHNHPDYRGMPGTAELSVMANGYYIRTRHNDYKIYAPVQGSYTARKEIMPPRVPTAISALPVGAYTDVASATPTSQYSYMKNIYQNHASDCVYFLTYAEVWFEDFTGGTGDYTDSFRHSTDADSMKDAIEKAIYFNAGGHKNRRENIPYAPVIVRRVTSEGQPVLAALRYRLNSFPVGHAGTVDRSQTMYYSDGSSFSTTLKALPFNETKAYQGELDPDNVFVIRKDLRQTMRGNKVWGDSTREWADMARSGRTVFDLQRYKLRELCELVPGMMGQGASILEAYDQYGLEDNLTVYGDFATPLNAAYYNHRYSMVDDDASGRTSAHRSFNDPNLFVAKTDDPEVIDGFSYMIPLELLLRTPRESWNPYNLTSTSDPKVGGTRTGSTSTSPLSGYYYNKYQFTVPYDLYTDAPPDGTDAADTVGSAWVEIPDGGLTTNTVVDPTFGNVKLFRANGIWVFDLTEADGTPGHRKRFAIYAEYQDYSKPGSDLELYKKAMQSVLTKVVAGTVTQTDVDNVYKDPQHTI